MPADEKVKLQRAVGAVETGAESGILTLGNGTVVQVKAVPDLLIQALFKQFPTPKPPMQEVSGGGKTWMEENPSHPDYIEALKDQRIGLGNAMLDLYMLRGLEVVSVADEVPDFEYDGAWVEEPLAIGLEIPRSGVAQRVLWARYWILNESTDFEEFQAVVRRLSGVDEEDVEATEARF